MRNLLLYTLTVFVLFSCKQKDKKEPVKKVENADYIISKDGINELKIGMKDTEVEKLVNQQFKFNSVKDAPGYWQDTIKAKYKNIEVSLYFERQYSDEDSSFMQLSGVETNSPLCKTESGIGIGDEKSAVLPAYEDNPITMGPEYEAVNDSTWAMSKIKYSISVKDDKWDKELIFHLVNKKIVSLEAALIMGD
ncbi:MAG: hypothetical protein ABIR30_07530 [Chitinophagaceae bacterium]